MNRECTYTVLDVLSMGECYLCVAISRSGGEVGQDRGLEINGLEGRYGEATVRIVLRASNTGDRGLTVSDKH